MGLHFPLTEVTEVIFPDQYGRASLKSSVPHINVTPVCKTQIGVCGNVWVTLLISAEATLVLIFSLLAETCYFHHRSKKVATNKTNKGLSI